MSALDLDGGKPPRPRRDRFTHRACPSHRTAQPAGRSTQTCARPSPASTEHYTRQALVESMPPARIGRVGAGGPSPRDWLESLPPVTRAGRAGTRDAEKAARGRDGHQRTAPPPPRFARTGASLAGASGSSPLSAARAWSRSASSTRGGSSGRGRWCTRSSRSGARRRPTSSSAASRSLSSSTCPDAERKNPRRRRMWQNRRRTWLVRGRVAATPRPPAGYSVDRFAAAARWIDTSRRGPPGRLYSAETSRGAAAARTWIVRGDESRRRRGPDVDSPWRRAAALARTWIVRGDESRRRRGPAGSIPWRRVAATPRPGRG